MDLFDLSKIINIEAKRAIGKRVSQLVEPNTTIAVGSGTTAYVCLFEIARRLDKETIAEVRFVSSSLEINLAIKELELELSPSPFSDWIFDGADQIDPEKRIIKGRGGALLREKLLWKSARKQILVVDSSKFVAQLDAPVAVEVDPAGIDYVNAELANLSQRSLIRTGSGKDGPVFTESGNLIIDCQFEKVDESLESELKSITGVIESGLFIGFDPEIISAQDN